MREGFSGVSADRVGLVQHEKLPVGMVEANDTVGDCFDLADLHQFLCSVERRVRQARLKIAEEPRQRRSRARPAPHSTCRLTDSSCLARSRKWWNGRCRTVTASSRTPKSRLRRISFNLTPIFGIGSFSSLECLFEIACPARRAERRFTLVNILNRCSARQLQSNRGCTIVTTFLAPQATQRFKWQTASTNWMTRSSISSSQTFSRYRILAAIEATVKDIIANVRAHGDDAVGEYSRTYDRVGYCQPSK